MTITHANKVRIEACENFLPCIFDPLHFIYFLCFFHKLLFSDVDSALRALEVESIVDISTNTLFTAIGINNNNNNNGTSNVHKELTRTWYSPIRRYSCYYNYHIQFQIA